MPSEVKSQNLVRRIHFVVGLVFVFVFIGTGMYMRLVVHGLRGVDPLPRMLFRSAHIYILLTSLINLALGLCLPDPPAGGSKLRNAGSTLILLSPALMTLAFFVEPGLAGFERPFAGPGVYAVFAGMILHFIAWARR